MPGEGKEHKRIRKRVEREVERYLASEGKVASHRVRAGHEKGAGTIGLYLGHPSRMTRMSDADMVIVNDKNEAACIIEVKDKDVMPKNLFGIVGATSVCNTIYHEAHGNIPLAEAALYIVVSANCVRKPQSTKKKQLELIEKQLADGVGSVSRVAICVEDEFAKRFRL